MVETVTLRKATAIARLKLHDLGEDRGSSMAVVVQRRSASMQGADVAH